MHCGSIIPLWRHGLMLETVISRPFNRINNVGCTAYEPIT